MCSLLIDLGVAWPVLHWARHRLLSCASPVQHTVTLAPCDGFKRLLVPLSVQNEPLVVTKQFVLLLGLVNFLLVGKCLSLCSFFSYPLLKLFEMLINLLSCLLQDSLGLKY